MSQLALAHDSLLPRAPGGQGPGAAVSLMVHAGLIAALTTSVDWRSQTPEVFSAELWASVPQAAAPAPVEAAPVPVRRVAPPPPAPAPAPEVDIAIERDRKLKADAKQRDLDDRKKADAERKRLADDKKQADDERKLAEQQALEAKADDERLAKQREENLKRMMGQAGATTTSSNSSGSGSGSGNAAQSAGPSAGYAGRVRAKVLGFIVFPGNVPGTAVTEIEVTTASGGSIMSSRIHKKSGYPDWDAAVLRAVDKAESLPRDVDGRVPPSLILSFRRE